MRPSRARRDKLRSGAHTNAQPPPGARGGLTLTLHDRSVHAASLNIPHVSTPRSKHQPRSWSKAEAPVNIQLMSLTLSTAQPPMSWLNDEACRYASGQVEPAASQAKGRSRIVHGQLVSVEARVFVRRASRRGDYPWGSRVLSKNKPTPPPH